MTSAGPTPPGGRTAEPPTEDVGPTTAISALNEDELAVLQQVGEHWRRAVGGRRAWLRALPVDPALPQFPAQMPDDAGRFPRVDFVGGDEPGEVEATEHALAGRSRPARAQAALRRTVFGVPLTSSAVATERMRKLIALPILSSDALSSVAYGPEAMLAILALAGTAALGLSLAISAVIVVLMIAVGASYRQIIRAYPHGGGSYIVAGATLGELPALVAAAGLLIDYILTVAVSISSGVAAVTSAFPSLTSARVEIGLGVIALLLVGNLRGVREAGAWFSAPTYAFILAMGLLIVGGLADAAGRGFARVPVTGLHPVEGLTALLVLRAFSSGATAMTGIEAISNSVAAFKPPAPHNARIVLTTMVSLLIAMFAGLVVVFHLDGIVPRGGETLLSALAHRVYGHGVLYGYVQAATALVLLLAANTAFNGFPRLLSFMARRGHAPRPFLRLGDRLAFTNGIVALSVAAAAIYTVFGGKTDALIPLYAVGVFVAFTCSQSGMVVHWWRRRDAGWRRGLVINALGAALSAIVFVIAGVTKFTQGSWVALVLIAVLVAVTWRIRRHYLAVRGALALRPLVLDGRVRRIVPRPQRPVAPPPAGVAAADTAGERPHAEREEAPDQLAHLAVVPVARLDLSSLRALAYAASLAQPVLAVHISPSEDEERRFRSYWTTWGDHLPLQIVESPYRALVAPMARYIVALGRQRPDLTITVVLPDLIVCRRWQQPLHNGFTRRLARMLREEPGIIVTTVPFHLPA